MKPAAYALHAGHPFALVALGALGLVVLYRLVRADVALSKGRRVAASVLAWLALACAALAAGDVEIVRPADRMNVVVLVDVSRSIELVPGAEAKIREGLTAAELGMLKDDRLAVVKFGATASLAEPFHAKNEGGGAVQPTVARDATDLETGLRRAVDEVLAAGGGRIVLVSDGVQNRGDVLAAAARARSLGVPVDVIVLDQQVLPDVRVVAARGPSLADEGETIEVRAVVHSPPADKPIDVEVEVKRDGVAIAKFVTKVASGEDVVRYKDKAPDPGLHRYDVHVRPLDSKLDASVDDNEATTFVRVRGPSMVLVLQKEEKKANPLRVALENEGYRVHVRGRFSVPTDLAELAAYDLVVLADIPAKDLLPSQMEAMEKYVKDFGGGLLLFGSDSSMGPGGYGKTPIEDISPVSFDLVKEKRRSQLSELIVIDFSGSMGARVDDKYNKLDLANEAAARSAALLGKDDRLGVWHVDTTIYETVKMGPVLDPVGIAKKIRSVGVGGGGIFIDLSLREGYKALEKESHGLKHMLLFSDGADAEERNEAPSLVKAAAKKGITTSVIALGDGWDVPALADMAKLGGGRFYLITDARKLPAVFAQETVLAAKSSVHEEEFVPRVRSSSSILKGIDWKKAPSLRGYVVTQVKPRAQLLLDGPEGDPILVTWPIGLGHVAAWASDYTDQWGGPFVLWPSAAQLMTQLAREVGRKADEARVKIEAQAKDGVLHVTAEPTTLSGSAGLLHLKAHVEGPDGAPRDVELLPGPGGTYVTTLPIGTPGAYVVRAIDVGDDGKGTQSAGLAATVLSRADELRPTGSDRRTLERIAEVTGGVVDAPLGAVFARRTGLRPTPLPLAPYLLPAALALMLLGVAARRLGLPQRHLAAKAPVVPKTSAKIVQVALPKPVQRPADAPLVVKPPTAPSRPEPAASAAATSGLAAAMAQKRKDAAEKKVDRPAAPVIVREPKKKAEEAGGSLADLAKKKREKKGG